MFDLRWFYDRTVVLLRDSRASVFSLYVKMRWGKMCILCTPCGTAVKSYITLWVATLTVPALHYIGHTSAKIANFIQLGVVHYSFKYIHYYKILVSFSDCAFFILSLWGCKVRHFQILHIVDLSWSTGSSGQCVGLSVCSDGWHYGATTVVSDDEKWKCKCVKSHVIAHHWVNCWATILLERSKKMNKRTGTALVVRARRLSHTSRMDQKAETMR